MEDILIKANVTKFASEVMEGLSAFPKYLHSKHLYDECGDRLFKAIMLMPEYYLTDSEYEIFSSHKDELIKTFTETKNEFILIELGAGDALKTKLLLKQLSDEQVKFKYMPIDISANAIEKLEEDLASNIPAVTVQGINDEFLPAIEKLKNIETRKVILFLGSSIGNFESTEALEFLSDLAKTLSPDDLFLIGFDLKKDPSVILDAYNDKQGITGAFNFNILERINKELGGNFDISKFKHYPTYDPINGEARSYLISKQKQDVYIEAINKVIFFDQWEPIKIEVSKKYDLESIEKLAKNAGFTIKYNFYDCRNYFVDSVWNLS
ncbi:MAG: L-histidine N(alpha)-methyltransferase [Bacteroidetes bacterium]|nr:L-histidine N(alpha)-methyltransferase [Bacteroidota bacterium]HET6245002.1 L-histidine N(alpha)-methyltransferase [Bacteroidia bacterium]